MARTSTETGSARQRTEGKADDNGGENDPGKRSRDPTYRQ
jgi:hypothetical protein